MERVNPQLDTTAIHGRSWTGFEIFERGHGPFGSLAGTHHDVAERQPELLEVARKRRDGNDRVGLIIRMLDVGDHIVVRHEKKPHI